MITDSLWEFCTAGKIKFGDGAVGEAGWEAKRLGGSRILVITDGGVAKAGLLDKVKRSLKKENLEIGVFDCVQPDPSLQVYDDCLRYARQVEYDLVIGLGGGSSMDVAKVTAALLAQGGEPLDYVAEPTGRGLPIKKGLPNIAIPTTSGFRNFAFCTLTFAFSTRLLYKTPILPNLPAYKALHLSRTLYKSATFYAKQTQFPKKSNECKYI